jgi:glycosyltransferase involved in cell wall biosynthesis
MTTLTAYILLFQLIYTATALFDFDADVTFLVKTHERPQCLRKLLLSLRTQFPRTRVIVADDGRVSLRHRLDDELLTLLTLPYDVGLSAGRNAMLERVETKYFITLDDDFVLYDSQFD